MTFPYHLRRAGTRVLERVPAALRDGIYVLAFHVWRVDCDDRRPYADRGYTTESRYEEDVRNSSGQQEVRWNCAFCILDGFERLGNVPGDPVGGPLFEAEAGRLGIWCDGAFDLGRLLDDADPIARSDPLRLHFREAVFGLARHLHAGGAIERIFGRPLPVVVCDMDEPGREEETTRAANPPELIVDFLVWRGR
ncbi:hypothetical protein ACFVWY_27470 [Streptomyces sp. NPDC058195]|uniref:hypothetical protein n=1 Tax=Streptomyces sp. NPDC058195 TaxID=3346375 RepID=UPI0036EF8365